MGIFDGILICTDFDGTFALSGTRISRENCKAVRYFQENGGLFTIATGRSPDFIMSFGEFTLNAPMIAANGTMLCDPRTGEKLMEFPLPKEAAEVIAAAAKQPFTEYIYICGEDGHGKPWHKSEDVPIDRFCEEKRGPWFKIVFEQSVENTAALKKWALDNWAGAYEFSRSWNCGLECQAAGTGKGESIARIGTLLGGIRLSVGVGDYENDISLIKCADIGYAVANAAPEAKAAADRITVSNDEHALARIIEEIEREFI